MTPVAVNCIPSCDTNSSPTLNNTCSSPCSSTLPVIVPHATSASAASSRQFTCRKQSNTVGCSVSHSSSLPPLACAADSSQTDLLPSVSLPVQSHTSCPPSLHASSRLVHHFTTSSVGHYQRFTPTSEKHQTNDSSSPLQHRSHTVPRYSSFIRSPTILSDHSLSPAAALHLLDQQQQVNTPSSTLPDHSYFSTLARFTLARLALSSSLRISSSSSSSSSPPPPPPPPPPPSTSPHNHMYPAPTLALCSSSSSSSSLSTSSSSSVSSTCSLKDQRDDNQRVIAKVSPHVNRSFHSSNTALASPNDNQSSWVDPCSTSASKSPIRIRSPMRKSTAHSPRPEPREPLGSTTSDSSSSSPVLRSLLSSPDLTSDTDDQSHDQPPPPPPPPPLPPLLRDHSLTMPKPKTQPIENGDHQHHHDNGHDSNHDHDDHSSRSSVSSLADDLSSSYVVESPLPTSYSHLMHTDPIAPTTPSLPSAVCPGTVRARSFIPVPTDDHDACSLPARVRQLSHCSKTLALPYEAAIDIDQSTETQNSNKSSSMRWGSVPSAPISFHLYHHPQRHVAPIDDFVVAPSLDYGHTRTSLNASHNHVDLPLSTTVRRVSSDDADASASCRNSTCVSAVAQSDLPCSVEPNTDVSANAAPTGEPAVASDSQCSEHVEGPSQAKERVSLQRRLRDAGDKIKRRLPRGASLPRLRVSSRSPRRGSRSRPRRPPPSTDRADYEYLDSPGSKDPNTTQTTTLSAVSRPTSRQRAWMRHLSDDDVSPSRSKGNRDSSSETRSPVLTPPSSPPPASPGRQREATPEEADIDHLPDLSSLPILLSSSGHVAPDAQVRKGGVDSSDRNDSDGGDDNINNVMDTDPAPPSSSKQGLVSDKSTSCVVVKKEDDAKKKLEGKTGILPEFVTIRRVVRRVCGDGSEQTIAYKVRVRPERILSNGDVIIRRKMRRLKDDGSGTETLTVMQIIPKKKEMTKKMVQAGGRVESDVTEPDDKVLPTSEVGSGSDASVKTETGSCRDADAISNRKHVPDNQKLSHPFKFDKNEKVVRTNLVSRSLSTGMEGAVDARCSPQIISRNEQAHAGKEKAIHDDVEVEHVADDDEDDASSLPDVLIDRTDNAHDGNNDSGMRTMNDDIMDVDWNRHCVRRSSERSRTDFLRPRSEAVHLVQALPKESGANTSESAPCGSGGSSSSRGRWRIVASGGNQDRVRRDTVRRRTVAGRSSTWRGERALDENGRRRNNTGPRVLSFHLLWRRNPSPTKAAGHDSLTPTALQSQQTSVKKNLK